MKLPALPHSKYDSAFEGVLKGHACVEYVGEDMYGTIVVLLVNGISINIVKLVYRER